MNKVHVKTGDEVIVINGKYRGKKGKVLAVSPAEGKVIVEGTLLKNMLSLKRWAKKAAFLKQKVHFMLVKFSLYALNAAVLQEQAAL